METSSYRVSGFERLRYQTYYNPRREEYLEAVCTLAEKAVLSSTRGRQNGLLTCLINLARNESNLENRVQSICALFYTEEDLMFSLVVESLRCRSSKEVFSMTLDLYLKWMETNVDKSSFLGSGCEPFIYYALMYKASVEILQILKDAGCRFDLKLPCEENCGDHIYSAIEFQASDEVFRFLINEPAMSNIRNLNETQKLAIARGVSKATMNLLFPSPQRILLESKL